MEIQKNVLAINLNEFYALRDALEMKVSLRKTELGYRFEEEKAALTKRLAEAPIFKASVENEANEINDTSAPKIKVRKNK